MKVILTGPPSVGKTTQGRLLARDLGVPHVSSGALIRERAAAGDLDCMRLAGQVADGSLAPSDAIISLVLSRLAQDDCAAGFVLDGFPRKAVEVEALLDAHAVDAFVVLLAEPEALMARVRVRAASGSGRDDDDPEVFPRRVLTYLEETIHVRAQAMARGVRPHEVDAEGSVDIVANRIAATLRTQPDLAMVSGF